MDGRVPRWPALIREALAVLAAILVAFALDAWWEGRQERGLMLEALDAVAIEVGRNLALVDSTLLFNQGRAEAVGAAAMLDPAEIDALDDDALRAFGELPDYRLATLELGAATAFIEGGFLAVLDDRELRADIAGLPRLQQELDEEASLVTSQSERLNVRVLEAFPIEAFVRPAGPTSPEATRALLRILAEDEDALRVMLGRTFFLSYLYAGELGTTRARLETLAAAIAEYREG